MKAIVELKVPVTRGTLLRRLLTTSANRRARDTSASRVICSRSCTSLSASIELSPLRSDSIEVKNKALDASSVTDERLFNDRASSSFSLGITGDAVPSLNKMSRRTLKDT